MAKQRILSLSKQMESLKSNQQMQLKSKDLQLSNIQKQLQDMERQRDEIKFRLMMDQNNHPIVMNSIENDQVNNTHANNSTLTQIDKKRQILFSGNFDSIIQELKHESERATNEFSTSNTLAKQQLEQLQVLSSKQSEMQH